MLADLAFADMVCSVTETEILIVDDDCFNSYALASLLQQFKVNFHLSTCGHEAVTQVKRRHSIKGDTYKLIFLDQNLPDINGIETAMEIKTYFGAHTLVGAPPFFCLFSISGSTESVRQASEAGI